MTEALYTNRRSRVALQVCSKWIGTDDWSDEQMLAVVAAADMAFRTGINDLDWEDATFERLRQGTIEMLK
jgi:hypothetical protein